MAWSDTNWKAECQKASAYAADNNSKEDPVGIMRWGPPGNVALYGHVGETAEARSRALHTAIVARSLLANANVEVHAAAFDQEHRAWAILAESEALDLLDAIVLEAWQIAEAMVGQ